MGKADRVWETSERLLKQVPVTGRSLTPKPDGWLKSKADKISRRIREENRACSSYSLTLFKSKNPDVRIRAFINGWVPESLLLEGIADESAKVAVAAAAYQGHDKYAFASEQVGMAALSHENELVRVAAASNPTASLRVITEALAGSSDAVKAAAASNPRALPNSLETGFQTSDSVAVRLSAVSNTPQSYRFLFDGFRDEEHLVREAAKAAAIEGIREGDREDRVTIADQSCDETLMWMAFRDRDATVRSHAAENPAASQAMLAEAAEDPMPSVRRAAGRNMNISERLLSQLANDPEEWVRAGVAANRRTRRAMLTKLLHESSIDVRLAVLKRSPLPQTVLLAAAKNPDVRVRVAAAGHRDICHYVWDNALRESQEPRVVKALASNEHCPPDVLMALGKRGGVAGFAVARNRSTPREVLAAIADDGTSVASAFAASLLGT